MAVPSLNSIFEAITPENIKNIPVVKNTMDIFIKNLNANSKVARQIISLYDTEIYQDDSDKVISAKQKIRNGLSLLYIYTLYRCLQNLSESKEINKILNKFNYINSPLRKYQELHGITTEENNIINNLAIEHSKDSEYKKKEAIKKEAVKNRAERMSQIIEDYIQKSDSVIGKEKYDIDYNFANAVIDDEYLGSNRNFTQKVGTKTALEYIYSFAKYIETGEAKDDLTITEINPFIVHYEGSLNNKIFSKIVKLLAHPLGWVYDYSCVFSIALEDFFGIEFKYIFNSIELHNDSGSYVIFTKQSKEAVYEDFRTRLNPRTNLAFTDEEIDKQVIIHSDLDIEDYQKWNDEDNYPLSLITFNDKDKHVLLIDTHKGYIYYTTYEDYISGLKNPEMVFDSSWTYSSDIKTDVIFKYRDDLSFEKDIHLGWIRDTDHKIGPSQYRKDNFRNKFKVCGDPYVFNQGIDESRNRVLNLDKLRAVRSYSIAKVDLNQDYDGYIEITDINGDKVRANCFKNVNIINDGKITVYNPSKTYSKNDYVALEGVIYQSLMDNNKNRPGAYPTFLPQVTYNKGNKVSYNNVNYISLIDNNHEDISNVNAWREYDYQRVLKPIKENYTVNIDTYSLHGDVFTFAYYGADESFSYTTTGLNSKCNDYYIDIPTVYTHNNNDYSSNVGQTLFLDKDQVKLSDTEISTGLYETEKDPETLIDRTQYSRSRNNNFIYSILSPQNNLIVNNYVFNTNVEDGKRVMYIRQVTENEKNLRQGYGLRITGHNRDKRLVYLEVTDKYENKVKAIASCDSNGTFKTLIDTTDLEKGYGKITYYSLNQKGKKIFNKTFEFDFLNVFDKSPNYCGRLIYTDISKRVCPKVEPIFIPSQMIGINSNSDIPHVEIGELNDGSYAKPEHYIEELFEKIPNDKKDEFLEDYTDNKIINNKNNVLKDKIISGNIIEGENYYESFYYNIPHENTFVDYGFENDDVIAYYFDPYNDNIVKSPEEQIKYIRSATGYIEYHDKEGNVVPFDEEKFKNKEQTFIRYYITGDDNKRYSDDEFEELRAIYKRTRPYYSSDYYIMTSTEFVNDNLDVSIVGNNYYLYTEPKTNDTDNDYLYTSDNNYLYTNEIATSYGYLDNQNYLNIDGFMFESTDADGNRVVHIRPDPDFRKIKETDERFVSLTVHYDKSQSLFVGDILKVDVFSLADRIDVTVPDGMTIVSSSTQNSTMKFECLKSGTQVIKFSAIKDGKVVNTKSIEVIVQAYYANITYDGPEKLKKGDTFKLLISYNTDEYNVLFNNTKLELVTRRNSTLTFRCLHSTELSTITIEAITSGEVKDTSTYDVRIDEITLNVNQVPIEVYESDVFEIPYYTDAGSSEVKITEFELNITPDVEKLDVYEGDDIVFDYEYNSSDINIKIEESQK